MTNPAAEQASASTPVKHIGVLLFDDVEELDVVGPWEVLANWTLRFPGDGWAVACVPGTASRSEPRRGSCSALTTRSPMFHRSTC